MELSHSILPLDDFARHCGQNPQRKSNGRKQRQPKNQRRAPPPPAVSGDPFLDEMKRAIVSKKCGGNAEDVIQESDDNSSIEFVANLPACADIR
jgi:hypothetical protein